MTVIKVTKDMFEKLEYDSSAKPTAEAITTSTTQNVMTPTVLIVSSDSDLNAASYHLAQSMQNPLAANAIVTALVQESVLADFQAKVEQKMPPYVSTEATKASYLKVQEKLKQVNAKTIRPTKVDEAAFVGPVIVCDFTHEQLDLATGAVVTMHAFRTTKEAMSLCSKQGVEFANASVWCENHARAYEMVPVLPCKNFFINCFNVPLDCLQGDGSKAVMDKNYHYEKLAVANGSQKNIVFPFGTVFAN